VTFDYGRLYVFGERFTRGAIRVDAVDEIVDPFALTRAEIRPDRPLRFRWDEGSRLYDFVGTTWATLNIVSDRVVTTLRGGPFTGWATYPVDVRHKDGTRLHGYYGLAAMGRCGPIEDELSPIEVLPPPVPGGEAMPHYMGLRFRPETWDGSDCFSPEGTGFIFVSETLRDALVEAKISNLDLRSLSDVHRFVDEDE
jgi:Immunity protein family (Imm11)